MDFSKCAGLFFRKFGNLKAQIKLLLKLLCVNMKLKADEKLKIKYPTASYEASNLQRSRAAGYLVLAAFVKAMQAWLWLIARRNKIFNHIICACASLATNSLCAKSSAETEKIMNTDHIEKLRKKIDSLPKGNITTKNIRGKSRMYLQWREDGRQKSKYIKAAEEQDILAQIEERKQLEKALKKELSEENIQKKENQPEFLTRVAAGNALFSACDKVARYGKRDCIKTLEKYLDSDIFGKVCVIFGLRRTGKTTMIFQTIANLPKNKTAYIKIMSTDTMGNLNKDLKKLSESGYKYVFIDEVTLLEDFIDGASLFSDIYAMFGMKIVLSGTDSLGFALAETGELYDRMVTIHTTFIPFREYSRLLGIHDIDEYIRYGGTFRVGETDFDDPELMDEGISFRDDETTRKYIDTAIARNIQHSLACYQYGSHFRHLIDLYEAGELTNAINRIIEDMNHRFLISVLTRDFKSHDLGSAAQIDRKQAALENRSSILDEIDTGAVTDKLMEILSIRNQAELSIPITQAHVIEIREYLSLLELIMNIPAEGIGTTAPIENIVFTQPGMRYCQAQALVFSLMKDEIFRKYPAFQRKQITDKILEEVRGRMLEEIVLLETAKTLPKHKKAFKLFFARGEFDMVVTDTENISCEIFEIKHTDQIFPSQYRHLIDEEKCNRTIFEYGPITAKTILYRGEAREMDGIRYHNVVKYLEALR